MVELNRTDIVFTPQIDGSGKIIPPHLPTAVGSFDQYEFTPGDQQFIWEKISQLNPEFLRQELLDYIKLPVTLTATILSRLPTESI